MVVAHSKKGSAQQKYSSLVGLYNIGHFSNQKLCSSSTARQRSRLKFGSRSLGLGFIHGAPTQRKEKLAAVRVWIKASNIMEQSQEPSLSQPEGSEGVEQTSPNISRVGNLLFRQMLVGVNDGRFFMGAFHCLDKQGNIILQDAVEFRSTRRPSPSSMEQRCLGLILIPSSCRSSCHIDCHIEEQLSLLSLKQV